MMGRGRRLALGIFVLLVVDVIWVASSELSEYIFNDTGFNKPFFSTYLKTSMFSLYLLGFIFWSPWRHQCAQRNHNESIYQTRDRRTPPPVPIFTLDQLASSVARDSDANAQLTHLSEPKYVPLKLQELQEKSSDGESDDSSVKSVRFSKLTEVRQMSENEAVDAMMSRLSFSASVRAEQLAMQAANKLSVKEVMKISSIFCLLVFVSLEDLNLESSVVPVGVVWSIAGAILYACYMVFLKHKVPTEDRMDFTMFFGK
ncbi:Solute carrier family 35 member F5-like 14 [Homarus americanus]|uniref:Solute carrier family 35 member F5-like 14 n=1 Tax=Homarus americanus TaxID=6706 RepID=A0A8J5K0H4_HOMAM|nr:Solute carrier family 35 member F5-like 14 [Homarus americanus]